MARSADTPGSRLTILERVPPDYRVTYTFPSSDRFDVDLASLKQDRRVNTACPLAQKKGRDHAASLP
jgi:hypothetical protein